MALTRMLSVLMLILLPGGLVLLAAWLYASAVVEQMRAETGRRRVRFARAVVRVDLKQVWRRAQLSLSLR